MTFSFGSNNNTNTTGGVFGTTNTGGFGAAAANKTGGFGFGGTTGTAPPAFGASTSATTGAFGGFGTNTATSGGGLTFGGTQNVANTAAGGFGFGSTNTATQGGFGFGANKPAATATTSGFSFGSNAAPGFGATTITGGFGTTSTGGFGAGTGGFGATNTGGFGTGTGTLSQPALSIGMGAANYNTFKGFGQPQQQQQQQTNVCPNVSLYLAVCAPAFFGDERDEVLKKWNQLQAVWGSGKGFYAPGLPPVEFTPDNEFCRFKSVGYIKMPSFTPEEGLVELVIGKKDTIVREQQAGLVAELCKIYGGNVQICVEYVKPGPGDNKTRLCYYVQTRNANGETKKANTMEVYNHLRNDQYKQNIINLFIEHATPLVALSESQLKDYLDKPPRGLDPVVWEQGKRDNPDTSKYLPVPLVGFQELQSRFKSQETESTLLQGQLDKVAEDVCSVQQRQSTLLDQLKECNRKQRQMAHRVLQLVVKQECNRKRGVPIDGNEEQLIIRLENLQSQLMAPTQYMGKLNELLSQMSAKGINGHNNGSEERVRMSSGTESDIKEFLAWQQDGISEVTVVLKSDIKSFEAMNKKR